jgi:hypothetical protein
MATHKLLPGRPVALEALLDQLGILLQRLISLESLFGDMRGRPRSISCKPWSAYLGLPYYGTKSASEMFPETLTPRGRKQSRHLTDSAKEKQQISLVAAIPIPIERGYALREHLCERLGGGSYCLDRQGKTKRPALESGPAF